MTEHLPTVNATLNCLSALCMCAGFLAIRQGRRALHIKFMAGALTASLLFLISYLSYHYLHGSTKYHGEGAIRVVYFSILLTHTVLAAVVVPLVLLAVIRALKGKFEKHKRIARWTLPVWLYVSVTGVVIYLMLYRF
ncbi:MAG: DUF420 domain-containing protein [Planctomycetota bacterium]